MNPPFTSNDFDCIVIYLNERGDSIYCTYTSLILDNFYTFIKSEKFQRLEKVGNQFLIYMYIKRRF